MASAFQTLKESMHARLTLRPDSTPQRGYSQVPTNSSSITWKGMTLLGDATSIIGQAVRSLVTTVGQTLNTDDFPSDVDGVFLTSRLLIIGPPRKKLAERDKFRNDPERIRELICQKHGSFNSALLFDLAPGQSHVDIKGMKHNVVQFDLDRPTLEALREACAAIVSWLDMDEKNIAIVTCTNGIKSTCLVAACVWAELNGDTVRQGLCKFFEERMKLHKSYSELLLKLPPSYDRLLKTFEREKVENENMEIPLELSLLLIRRAPFRPHGDDVTLTDLSQLKPTCFIRCGPGFRRVERVITTASPETVEFHLHEGIWKMDFTDNPLILGGDVTFDVTTGLADDSVLFSFPVSIGSFNAGKSRFGPDAMDESRRHILPGDFDIELTFKDVDRLVEDASFAKAIPNGKELCSVRHVVKAAKHLVQDLLANIPAVEERDAIFALQRTNNDYTRAAALLKHQLAMANVASAAASAAMIQGDFMFAIPSTPMSNANYATIGITPLGGGQAPFVQSGARQVKPGVLAPRDVNSGSKRQQHPKSALSNKKGMTPTSSAKNATTTPLKRKLELTSGEEDDDDPTLSPFLRETIGRGLSSPVTPIRPGGGGPGKDEDAVGEMDKVLLAQLAQLLSTDASLVGKVEKLAEGKAAIVELDKVSNNHSSSVSVAATQQQQQQQGWNGNNSTATTSGRIVVPAYAANGSMFDFDSPRRIDFATTPMTVATNHQGTPSGGYHPTTPMTRAMPIGAASSSLSSQAILPTSTATQVAAHPSSTATASASTELKENKTEVAAATSNEPTVAQDETYGVFFKMLKMGVPRAAVEQKMKRDNFIVQVLDLGPNAPQSKIAELERELTKTIGQDETYAKYFKMLRMGVPAPAVQQRMDKDGVPREALDLGENAPLSKLEEVLKAAKSKANNGGNSAAKKKITRQKTVKWDAIPEERLNKRGVVTIWHHVEVAEDELQFTNDLENLFIPKPENEQQKKPSSALASASKSQQSDKSKEVKKKSILDARRAQSVCIGLAKLKLTGQEYASALCAMNESILTSKVLQVIQGCNLIPSPEEAALLLRQPADVPLAEPDEFLLQVARQCKDAAGRIEALTFRYLFEEIATQTKDDAVRLTEACKQVRSSEKLKDLLRVVLLVGNQINSRGEKEGEKIKAFTLASLLKLSQTRSLNKTTTVLDYLVQFLMNKMPQVLDVADELGIVATVKRADLVALTRQSKDLRKGLDAVSQNFKGLETFCADAFAVMTTLDAELTTAKQTFESVLDYFGEDREMTSVDFFTTLSSFLVSLGQTRKELVEREKRNARKKQQMLEAQKLAEKKAAAHAAKQAQQSSNSVVASNPHDVLEKTAFSSSTATATTKAEGESAATQEAVTPYPHLAKFLQGL